MKALIGGRVLTTVGKTRSYLVRSTKKHEEMEVEVDDREEYDPAWDELHERSIEASIRTVETDTAN
jgi:predicted methyltransferase MtxX (methanogen marker protein 4)